jgi:hypothetical protein
MEDASIFITEVLLLFLRVPGIRPVGRKAAARGP